MIDMEPGQADWQRRFIIAYLTLAIEDSGAATKEDLALAQSVAAQRWAELQSNETETPETRPTAVERARCPEDTGADADDDHDDCGEVHEDSDQ